MEKTISFKAGEATLDMNPENKTCLDMGKASWRVFAGDSFCCVTLVAFPKVTFDIGSSLSSRAWQVPSLIVFG